MLLHQMDLNLLTYLDVLLDEQSVVRAAMRLNITQPALSNALKRLREALKDELLIQTGRSMTRTRFAEQIRDPLRKSLQLLQEEVLARRDFDPTKDAFEFITAFHGYEERILLPILTQTLSRFENISILNRLPQSMDSGEELAKGTIHFTTTPLTSSRAGIMRCRLLSDEYVCVVHQGSGLASIDLATFCSLGHLLIAPHGGAGPVDSALAHVGLSRRIKVAVGEFNSAPFVLNEDKSLVTTVPSRLAKLWCEQFPLTVLPCPVTLKPLSIYLSWHGSIQASQPHNWFKDLLLGHCQATETRLSR